MRLNKMREEMAASFLAALKEEKMPWHKEWSSINGRPCNAINGSYYRGVNAFWLAYNQEIKDYADPRWCTYKQAKAQGWQVRKGEKGTKVEFWSLYDTETKEKLTKQQAEELQKQLSKDEFYVRIKPISNVYTVFNGEQIEGIPELIVERHMLDEQSLMEKRDVLLKNMEVGFQEGKEGASYHSKTDVIEMPDIDRFESEYAYFSTFLHEAGHASGHESRLNRNLGNTFGSPEYAKEELRAEIASAFTAQALGIDSRNQEHMENHKAYVQSWIKVLEKNPEELFAAIRDAERISDYLIEKGEFEIAEVKQLEKGNKNLSQEFDESQYNTEEVYSRLTESEKQNFDMSIDYGDMEGAKKIIEEKRKELFNQTNRTADKNEDKEPEKNGNPRKSFYTREESEKMAEYLKDNVSIVDVCRSFGYTPVRVGQAYYTLKEHDSVRLDTQRNCFFWNSTGDKGSVIDACVAFENMSKAEAFQHLYDMCGGKETVYENVCGIHAQTVSEQKKPEPKKEKIMEKPTDKKVELPPKVESQKNVYAYLGKTRCISQNVIKEFFERDMLYQDNHNNCVFVARNEDGTPVFGCKRGTNTYKKFVADCKGNDYNKGFYVDNGADKLFVSESVIDAMSKMTMLQEEGIDFHSFNYLSLAGTQKQDPIKFTLDAHPEIKEVSLGLDNDNGGLEAFEQIKTMFEGRDILLKKDMPIQEGQDWNGALCDFFKAKSEGKEIKVCEETVISKDGVPFLDAPDGADEIPHESGGMWNKVKEQEQNLMSNIFGQGHTSELSQDIFPKTPQTSLNNLTSQKMAFRSRGGGMEL